MADITSQIAVVGTTALTSMDAVYTDPSTGRHMNVKLSVYYSHSTDHPERAHLLNRLIRQSNIWSRVSHPNITPLIGRCTATELGLQCLVYPSYENGSIADYLHSSMGSTTSQSTRISMIVDIAKAVQFIHASDVVHGEINTMHVLVDKEGKALLHGFARAKVLGHKGHTTEKPNGPVDQFIPPELLASKDNSQLTKEADVYSFGLIALYILSGRLPFARRDPLTAAYLGCRPVQSSDFPEVKPQLWGILSRCAEYYPGSRITIDEALHDLVQANH